MLRKLLWGKRLPRKIVYFTGLYQIGMFFYDWGYPAVRQNYMTEPIDTQARYGQRTVAVVTGATTDLGRAYAQRLSQDGFRLILVDDDDQKLNEVSKSLCNAPTFTFDFKNKSEWQDYQELCDKIKSAADNMFKAEISVLVNNVAEMDPRKGKIHKASDEELI